MNTFEVTLSPESLEALAEKIAQKLTAQSPSRRALTVKQAAEALSISYTTINTRIKAGEISLVPNIGARRVPQSEIARLLGE